MLTDRAPKVTDQPKILFGLNLEQHSSLKVRGSENNSIIQKLLKSKNPCGFVTETFKIGVTNPRVFLDLGNFYIIKLISEPLTTFFDDNFFTCRIIHPLIGNDQIATINQTNANVMSNPQNLTFRGRQSKKKFMQF